MSARAVAIALGFTLLQSNLFSDVSRDTDVYLNAKQCTNISIGINPTYVSNLYIANKHNNNDLETDELSEMLYLKLPNNIKNELANIGWEYELTTKEFLQQISGVKNVIGYTDLENHIVYVENENKSINRALLHEYGHAVSAMITKALITDLVENHGIPTEDLQLDEIFEEEKEKFSYSYRTTDKHEISNIAEYLASTFHDFIMSPNTLQNNCPRTYKFWEIIINNI